MNTGVNSPNLSISDNIAEGGAIIDDNIGHKMLVKECDSFPHIDAQCVSYDKTTGFVYIDYDKGHIDRPKYMTAETFDTTISWQLVIMFSVFAIIFFMAEFKYCSTKRRQHG